MERHGPSIAHTAPRCVGDTGKKKARSEHDLASWAKPPTT